MPKAQDPPVAGAPELGRRLAALVVAVQVAVFAGGLVSFLGYVLDQPRFTDWVGNGISIQPNTTLAVMASSAGVALLALGRTLLPRVLGAFTAAIGATVLLEYAAGIDLGIDQLLLFDRTWGRLGVISPGRMGPPGAASWTLLGTALCLASFGAGTLARKCAALVALPALVLASLSLAGYLYRASPLYTIPTLTVIALQTSAFVLLIALGLVASVREHEPMRLLLDGGPAGYIVRRLVPVLVALPVLIGFLRLEGERAGLYDTSFGTAIRTLCEITLFLVLLWFTATAIRRHSQRRLKADDALRASQEKSHAQLEAEVTDTQLLQGISGEMIVGQDPPRLQQRVLEGAMRILRSDFATLQLCEPAPSGDLRLRLLAARGLPPAIEAAWQLVELDSRTACAAALRERRRCIVPDVDAWDGVAGTPHAEPFRQAGVRAVQSTPLVSRGGRMLGMLSTHWRAPHQPSDRDLRLLDILARQAADLVERGLAEAEREDLLRREREARADAERNARVKDEFLATLSHELRTPLNAIIGWSQILKQDVADPERTRHAVEVIERNGRAQAQLIADLLDMSRIISGKVRLELRETDLRQVVDATIETVRPAAEGKDVRLVRDLGDAPATIAGDPERLQQIVWNLLSNGVKFTPSGGKVEVTLRAEDGRAVLRVRDDGGGIPPEFLPHIFERFRQADSSTARRHGGLGLGLALAKQLVELHGGSIRAASAGTGRGAEFEVALPLAEPAAAGAAPARDGAVSSDGAQASSGAAASDGAAARGGASAPEPARTPRVEHDLDGLRVLLVDDEPDALEFVRRTLTARGARVATARSAADALASLGTAGASGFDLLVSDIGMPERDGYELVVEIRARGHALPALALTAFARDSDRELALRAGYQAHVPKPVDRDVLLATIAALAGRPSALA